MQADEGTQNAEENGDLELPFLCSIQECRSSQPADHDAQHQAAHRTNQTSQQFAQWIPRIHKEITHEALPRKDSREATGMHEFKPKFLPAQAGRRGDGTRKVRPFSSTVIYTP